MSNLKINIVTNWAEHKGLWRDGCLLERLLLTWGHAPVQVQYDAPGDPGQADLNIFLETVAPSLLPLARSNWWVVNPEWASPDYLACLPQLDRVLCKTREAEQLLAPLTNRAVYVGWESEDRYDASVPREAKVLHVAGGSILKGTQAVLEAWERFRLPYSLTVVGDPQVVKPRSIPKVTYAGWVDDAELKRHQNSHRIHLQPSETEGWGHTIHEGLSVNATVITTDRIAGFHVALRSIQSFPSGTRSLASLYRVTPDAVARSVLELSFNDDLVRLSTGMFASRPVWCITRDKFRQRLHALLLALS